MSRWKTFGTPGSGSERRWRSSEHGTGPSRSLVAALLLACGTMITLDLNDATDSALDPARSVLGDVIGPMEKGTSAAMRPITAIPDRFRSNDSMQRELDELRTENSQLRKQVNSVDYNRNRLSEYDGLTASAESLGRAMVPARVIGYGPSQNFSSTVTIDAGSDAGLKPDMTVINNDGLVGRVLQVSHSTATVLLINDTDSVVGSRVGQSMEIGFMHGRGGMGEKARLDLELLDDAAVPARNDTVLTWGSQGGAPYVSGVPIGKVTKVFSDLRDQTKRVEIEPFVDFGSLDVVGVVVPSGSVSDRSIVEADGSLR